MITAVKGPYDHLVGDDQDLGEGLFTAELFWWAEKKRNQNLPHAWAGHRMCRICKNCTCGRQYSPWYGFRCICNEGKTMVTPYRIRWPRTAEKVHAAKDEIYCLTHHIYEPRNQICSAD